MITKEKTSIRVGARTEAAGGTSGETNSDFHFTTSGNNSQGGGRIWQLLPEGEALAVPANDLITLAGYKNSRSLRAEIDREREQGFPVLASELGYFRPASGDCGISEVRRFLRRQDARAASNRRTTRLIRARLREIEHGPLPGQVDFWEDGDT